MTRAKDISKIVTDANLSGTLDVTGAVTAGGLTSQGNIEIDGSENGNVAKVALTRTDASFSINNETNLRIYGNTGDTTSPTPKRMEIAVNGDISFYEDTGTTPKFFWDSSEERLGIGTASPSVALDITGGNSLLSRAAFTRTDTSSTLEAGAWFTSGPYVGSATNHPLQIITNNTERMRILANGDIAINSTTTSSSAFTATHLRIDTDTSKNSMLISSNRENRVAYGVHADGSSGIRYAMYIVNGAGGEVGKISYTNTTVTYATTSDHRLKENVTADWDATTRLKQLNPVRFNFIVNANTTVDGFLAHEVQSVVPEAITGTHNEVDADGNPVYQGIDQSKLVPLLVKTIQELEARITALENGV